MAFGRRFGGRSLFFSLLAGKRPSETGSTTTASATIHSGFQTSPNALAHPASLRAEQENLVVPRPRPRSTSRARAGWARGQTWHEPPQSVTAVFYIDELTSDIYNDWSRSLIGAVAKSGSGEASLAIRSAGDDRRRRDRRADRRACDSP